MKTGMTLIIPFHTAHQDQDNFCIVLAPSLLQQLCANILISPSSYSASYYSLQTVPPLNCLPYVIKFVFQTAKHYHISVLGERSKNHARVPGKHQRERHLYSQERWWGRRRRQGQRILDNGNIATLQNELFLFLKLYSTY